MEVGGQIPKHTQRLCGRERDGMVWQIPSPICTIVVRSGAGNITGGCTIHVQRGTGAAACGTGGVGRRLWCCVVVFARSEKSKVRYPMAWCAAPGTARIASHLL